MVRPSPQGVSSRIYNMPAKGGWPGLFSVQVTSQLADLFAKCLQVLLDHSHELIGDGTVDEAVVVA